MSAYLYQLIATLQALCGRKRRNGSSNLSTSKGRPLNNQCSRIPRTSTTNGTMGRSQDTRTMDCRARNRGTDGSSFRSQGTMRQSNVGRNVSKSSEIESFIATNKDIVWYSKEGEQSMYNFLVQLSWDRRPLNAVNVATIFHSSAKMPNVLTPDVMDYLTDSMHRVDGFDARALGNLCYGLQGLKDSPYVHRVLMTLALKVDNCVSDFNPQQVGNALYGLQNLRDSREVRGLLRSLMPKVVACKEPFTSQAIASSCMGLRHLGNSLEVKDMFGVLASKVEQLLELSQIADGSSGMPSPSFRLDGQAIGTILNGLQCMDNSPEVLRLVLVVSSHAEKLTKPMKAQELSSAFYGLRSLRASPYEVRRLLTALRGQLKACTDCFLVRHIATVLYGMRWLGDSDEARSILLTCAEMARNITEPFDGHAIGNALYGLQSFPCCSEVQELLDAMAPKIEACQKPLTGQEIGNAFYGFRSMVQDCDEVRRILLALTKKLERCGKLDPQAMSNALYGLHSFTHIQEIAYPIIGMLTCRILRCEERFGPQAISNSFFGLQNMDDSPTSRQILAALTEKLDQCNEGLTPQHLGNMLYNVRSMGDTEEVHAFLRILKPRIIACAGTFQDDDIAHAFLGLSGLGGYVEVRDILLALTPHVESCKELNAQDVSICLNSFRWLNRVDEVRPLLRILATKVKNCKERMLEHHVRKALQGVRQFGDSEDVRLIFRVLAERAQQDGVSVAGTLLQKFVRHSR